MIRGDLPRENTRTRPLLEGPIGVAPSAEQEKE